MCVCVCVCVCVCRPLRVYLPGLECTVQPAHSGDQNRSHKKENTGKTRKENGREGQSVSRKSENNSPEKGQIIQAKVT